MEYKTYKNNNYSIHTIKSDAFKTIRIEIKFSNKIIKDDIYKYTFLCDLLTDTSKKYKTRKDMAIKLEELYKASFYGITNKVGKLFITTFAFEFINPIYIKDDKYLEDAIKFPFECINKPNIVNGSFVDEDINIIKKRCLKTIKRIKENSTKKAITNALKEMDKDSISCYKLLGNEESINKITKNNLVKIYNDLMNKSNIDILVIGNYDMDIITKLINKNFKYKSVNKKYELDYSNKLRNKEIKKEEKSNFVQSTLVMIYNIDILSRNDKNISFHLFNYIFGNGGITSKLYMKLRNENSLCYGVNSNYLKYDNLLIIYVSLDKTNINKAIKLINECVKDMQQGLFDDYDIIDTKKNLDLALNMGLDNNVSLLNNYYYNIIDNLPLIEERRELINKVNKEDIIKCANSLKLNTIYILDEGGL